MIQTVSLSALPEPLQHMHGAPQQLYVRSENESTLADLLSRTRIAIVGSRRPSPYGEKVTYDLAGQLASRGIVIVSGLAIGTDTIAHEAALEAGGMVIAILPGPVHRIYPRCNERLGRRILEAGGALISEYEEGYIAFKTNFVARNRIVSGISNALLITEAAKKSGTLHTAKFAREQGVDVFAVPGNIDSPTSVGTNQLIKDSATPVTELNDILYGMQLPPSLEDRNIRRIRGDNQYEQTLIDLMEQGMTDGHELLYASGLHVSIFNQNLTMLRITGKIRPIGANHWALA
jgi:DNA processing protein